MRPDFCFKIFCKLVGVHGNLESSLGGAAPRAYVPDPISSPSLRLGIWGCGWAPERGTIAVAGISTASTLKAMVVWMSLRVARHRAAYGLAGADRLLLVDQRHSARTLLAKSQST